MPSPKQAFAALTALNEAKFVNLDAPIKALVNPAGLGGASLNPAADDGPACLIHENYVFLHWPGKTGAIEEVIQKQSAPNVATRSVGEG